MLLVVVSLLFALLLEGEGVVECLTVHDIKYIDGYYSNVATGV